MYWEEGAESLTPHAPPRLPVTARIGRGAACKLHTVAICTRFKIVRQSYTTYSTAQLSRCSKALFSVTWLRYQALMPFEAPNLVLTDCALSVDSYSSSHKTQPAYRILLKAVGQKEPNTVLPDSATYYSVLLSFHDKQCIS